MSNLAVSVVVVAYNMPREIPRTVCTLSPTMQKGIRPEEYEIILVDNGSTRMFDRELCMQWGANLVFHAVADAGASPCAAVNAGLRLARGDLVGVMVDGARMASPGLLWGALTAQHLHPRPIISTLGFHLGPTIQSQSVHQGYDQAAEDQLLKTLNWLADGYRLFDIAAFAGSSTTGWFGAAAESNALFMPHELWAELGGFNEDFLSAGGGLANLDAYQRACELPDSQVIMLLGEGTFHQVHGGIATNALRSPWPEFHAEYVRIRNRQFAMPTAEAWLFGKPAPPSLRFIAASAELAMGGSMAASLDPDRGPLRLAKFAVALPGRVGRRLGFRQILR